MRRAKRLVVRYRWLRHCLHQNPEAAGDLLVIAVSSTLRDADKAAEIRALKRPAHDLLAETAGKKSLTLVCWHRQ
jgi:hypothetical protein